MRPPHLWVVGFLVLVASLTSVLVFGGAASSTLGPTMRLDPALVEVEGLAGETFSIDVLIEDITDLGGFEFEVHYDDTIANLDVAVGPFPGSTGRDVICIGNAALGIGTLACVILGTPGPSGAGVVAVLDFTLKLPFAGIGQLFLQGCNAADSNGNPIPLNACKDGNFVVPTPDPVGGVAVDPQQPLLALDQAEGPAGGLMSRAASLAAAAGAVLTMLAAGWYIRWRRLAS